MKLRYTRKALDHLSDIHAYTEQEWPGKAQSVARNIQNSISQLTRHPELGRAGRVEGTRELVIPRSPFIAVYRIESKYIDVLAIMHAARKWPRRV